MNIRKRKIRGYFALTVILITCLCIVSAMSFFMPYKRTEAISDLQQVKDLGNLLVDNYEEKGKIFDGNQLSKLYSALLSEDGATYADIKSATSGANGVKTSEDFRSEYNDGKDLVVTIGGLTWNVVYLSNTKSDGTGDPIVTLWLTDSAQLANYNIKNNIYDEVRWNSYEDNSSAVTNQKYPSNMYGTSRIRAVTLNNGGKYATSISALSSTGATQSYDNPFAMFTMPNTSTYKSSLTDFIVTPTEVEWQRKETSSYTTDGPNGYEWNFNNDALDRVTDSSFYPGNNNYYNYQLTPNASKLSQDQRTADYTAWGNDRIWLPSMAETGWYEDTCTGIWDTNANQRGNSAGVNSWLRSAFDGYYSHVYTLVYNGSVDAGYSAVESFAVRPAFHLNLAKADEAAYVPTPQTKGNTKKYYNDGNDLTFELDKIIASKLDITLTATDMEGNALSSPSYLVNNSVLSFNANQVGKYVVTVKPKDGECWADGSSDEKSYTYYLKYHVTPLLFASDPSNLAYKGTTQYIEVENYNEDFMTVTPSTG
ncbi:MAG: hypothetical protein K2J89_02800, partial [Clostridia bacterium]|nr:hypothetical protein [Clostridia bacterium]